MDVVKDSFILGVRNVPAGWSLRVVVKKLAPILRVRFTVLSFEVPGGGCERKKDRAKVAYVRFPRDADRQRILMTLQNVPVNSTHSLSAFIPHSVPDNALCAKGRTVMNNMAQRYNMVSGPPVKVLSVIVLELHREIQIKCNRLQRLRADVRYKLWQDIAHIIFYRMAKILRREKIEPTPYNMSEAYRKVHQHHTDASLVLNNLRRVEDRFGYPFTEITEEELLNLDYCAYSILELHKASEKVLAPVQEKVLEHIRQLDTSKLPQATAEQRAALQVRVALKKHEPYIAELIREVIMEDVLPNSSKLLLRAKIYGEPFLPAMETLRPIISHLGMMTRPCKVLFNCLNVKVDGDVYPDFLKIDGMLVGQSRLVCRPANIRMCQIPRYVHEKVKAFYM